MTAGSLTAPSGIALISILVGFGRDLRREGMTVGTDQLVTYAQAAARLGPTDAQDLYWAGRACLVSRREDLAIYDRAFRRWFAGAGQSMATRASGEVPRSRAELATGPTMSRGRTGRPRLEQRGSDGVQRRGPAIQALRRVHP